MMWNAVLGEVPTPRLAPCSSILSQCQPQPRAVIVGALHWDELLNWGVVSVRCMTQLAGFPTQNEFIRM